MSKPNVVFIIADQWSTRIAEENDKVETPGVDRIAAEGMSFEQSYSSSPLCCPARSSLFTGLMPHNNGLVDNQEPIEEKLGKFPSTDNILKETITLGEKFKQAGYETAYFGKEHAAEYAWEGIDNFGSLKFTGGGYLAEGSAFDQIFAKDAIEFINQDHDRPFYMTLSFINPHDICKTLGDDIGGKNFSNAIFFCRNESDHYLRGQDRLGLPDNYDSDYIKGMINHHDQMYNELDEYSENDWRRYISTYALLIEKTDWYIDLVLDSLAEAGLEEDTIVVFTSDHGDMMGSHGLIAKTTFYEESARTPFLIRYPGEIEAGEVDDYSLVSSIDIMPTLLDLCGLDLPEDIDGNSFAAQCRGENTEDFNFLVAENYLGKMLRFNDYKYVNTIVAGEEYQILFDLTEDPNETKNVFGQPGYQEVSKLAEQKLKDWLAEEDIELTFGQEWAANNN